MRVVIVGCGRLGAALALRMDRAGHDVTVIDASGAAFQNLIPDFHGKTLQGNVLSRDVLERAGAPEADGFAAVTNSDTVNAVSAHLARTEFKVPNVVVRNYAAGWLPLLKVARRAVPAMALIAILAAIMTVWSLRPSAPPSGYGIYEDALADTRDPGVEQTILTRNALSRDEVFSLVVERGEREKR